ncbi:hypothetical protein BG005_000450 [Podila minutissima]|nr:hypothetical protein BG005_000450 [Podila minutissima]
MPEQTDKRRSWWGILTPSDRSDPARASHPDLHAYKTMDTDYRSDHDDTASESGAHTNGHGNGKEGSQTLRRVSSKMDLFKKSTLPKRVKSRGGSKFATITTAFSSSKTTLPSSRDIFGSASSTTTDLNQYEKSGFDNSSIHTQQQPPPLSDTMVFTVTEQPEYIGSERERDVAYRIRAEGVTRIILINRRISDFLDFDEKVRVQYPKSRPALPLLDDRRKSFLVSTRQFFFPRKNTTEKLEAYLRKVASHEPLKSSTVFHEFLAISQEGDLVHSKESPENQYLYAQATDLELNSHDQGEEDILPRSAKQGTGMDITLPEDEEPTTPTATSYKHALPPHIDDAVVRREPKLRGNRVRPGLPQIQERKKANIDDFQLIKVLGRGCMGKVMLVREISSKKLFALKAISKEWVILQREIEHTKSERNILANVAEISHPFLIKLRHSFQSNAQLFMVLDYYPGGDIATQLAKWHKFEPERCLFYAAEIVLGIEELHRQGIVYRDLKPENILLALDGHIVLTDFGLSKQFPTFSANSPYLTEDKTNTFCGTAEYLAPEILKADEYSYAVDWWSLGTLLYEMLCGITPFWAENHAQMYQRVLEDDLEFPMDIDPDAASFISGLLERDPNYRLGSQGAAYVKEHPYFDSIDWNMAMQRGLHCPYVPELFSEEDLSNFDDAFLTMTPRLSPGNHTLSNSIQNCFQGYSYTDKMASTLPRSDSKIRLGGSNTYHKDHQHPGSRNNEAYIDGFDQEANENYGYNGQQNNAYNGHYPHGRSPLRGQPMEDSDDSEQEEFYQYRPLTQLYAPPSAAISPRSQIETKAQATSPALTPPAVHSEDGFFSSMSMTSSVSSRGGASAADILRGYSDRSIENRHNSTGSSHSSGTIRRLSRGYL